MPAGDPYEWPDGALREQAGRIGPGLLEAIDSEARWVHRRVERIEFANAAQVTRSVAADLTIPAALAPRLRLFSEEPSDDAEADAKIPSRLVIPLGTLGKAPLVDFSLTPADAHRLSSRQVNPLIVAAMAPYARALGADAPAALALLARIVLRERPAPGLVEELDALLTESSADPAAVERLRTFSHTLSDNYILVVALKADPGVSVRVGYAQRQAIGVSSGGFADAPLVLDTPLPYASGPSPYRVELVAPEGLEIETAGIVDLTAEPARPIEAQNYGMGEGVFAHLRAPDKRPASAGLNAVLGFPSGGASLIALIAGAASVIALGLAIVLSLVLEEKLKGSSASSLLAAPALVTGIALGLATTRVTGRAVNRLRAVAFAIAALGVLGALTVAAFSENPDFESFRLRMLVFLLVIAASLLAWGPARAVGRARATIPLTEVGESVS